MRNIILFIYVIIIIISIAVLILSSYRTETGIIELGDTVLVEVETNLLKPKIIKGDLVISDKAKKNVKVNDIISYITLENGKAKIRTNKIVAITKDNSSQKIYSLKKENGTIENIDDSCILGTYKMTIPLVGTILTYILSKRGFYTVVVLPSIILAILFLIDFLLDLIKSRKEKTQT